jgi:hypothetical protein
VSEWKKLDVVYVVEKFGGMGERVEEHRRGVSSREVWRDRGVEELRRSVCSREVWMDG